MTTHTSAIKAAIAGDDIAAQIAALRADLARLMETVSDDVSEGIGSAGRTLRRRGRDVQTSATNMAFDHPLATVGIAMTAAVLLVMLARRG